MKKYPGIINREEFAENTKTLCLVEIFQKEGIFTQDIDKAQSGFETLTGLKYEFAEGMVAVILFV